MNELKILETISPYIYGTTRLGDDQYPFEERVEVALAAMNSGVWFHTSHQYNNALDVLAVAFDKERTKVPKLIIKSFGNSLEELVEDIKRNLKVLGLTTLDVAQLCIGDDLAENFATGGSAVEGLKEIRDSGLVKSFVWEVFPWTSKLPTKALKNGFTKGIIDAFILYLNPLQRFASNELWNILIEQKQPIIAMRTVAGGPVHRLRDVPGAAWKDYLQKRAVEVAPIFERSGIQSWTEFCVRFAHSFPYVISTVGSSIKISRLQEFLAASKNIQPLQKNIIDDIVALQYRWSDETDIHAELWSM